MQPKGSAMEQSLDGWSAASPTYQLLSELVSSQASLPRGYVVFCRIRLACEECDAVCQIRFTSVRWPHLFEQGIHPC